MTTYRPEQDSINLSTLDKRLLVALLVGPMTGYQVARQCETDSSELPGGVSRGAIYPALKRMQQYKLINAITANEGNGQFYKISPAGRDIINWELAKQQTLVKLGQERLKADARKRR